MRKRDVLINTEIDGTTPRYGSELAAGADIFAVNEDDIIVPARGRAVIPSGLKVQLPEDSVMRIASRSGLAFKHGITVFDGVIDADYTGVVGILMFNNSDEDYVVKRGDRIAQMILIDGVYQGNFKFEKFKNTTRGENGFGSTGKN